MASAIFVGIPMGRAQSVFFATVSLHFPLIETCADDASARLSRFWL